MKPHANHSAGLLCKSLNSCPAKDSPSCLAVYFSWPQVALTYHVSLTWLLKHCPLFLSRRGWLTLSGQSLLIAWQERSNQIHRHRAREKIALSIPALKFFENRKLFLRLNTFCNDIDIQAPRHFEDSANQFVVFVVVADATDERTVNLEYLYRQTLEITQS